MALPRRKFLRLAGAAAAFPALSRVAKAQTYPSRPITMIVPFPAGGPYDVFGRLLAEHMRIPRAINNYRKRQWGRRKHWHRSGCPRKA